MKKKLSVVSGLLLLSLFTLNGCSWSTFGKQEIPHDFMRVVPELPPPVLLKDCKTLSMEQLIVLLESQDKPTRNIDLVNALVGLSAANSDCSLDKGALRAWRKVRIEQSRPE